MYRILMVLIAAVMATGCSVNHVHYRHTRTVHPAAFDRNVEYVFHYYPEAEVYHCPQLKVYAVYKAGSWTLVYSRPAALHSHHRYVVIKEKNCRPWWRHAYYHEASRRDREPHTVHVTNRRPQVNHDVYIHHDAPRHTPSHRERTVVRNYTENHYYRDKTDNGRHRGHHKDHDRKEVRNDDRSRDRHDRREDRIKDGGKDKDRHDRDSGKDKDKNKDKNHDRINDRQVNGRVPGYNNPHQERTVKEVKQKTKEVKLHQWGKTKDDRGQTDNGRFIKVEKEKKVTVKNNGGNRTVKTKSKTRVVRNAGNDNNGSDRTGDKDNNKDHKKDGRRNGKDKKNHVAVW